MAFSDNFPKALGAVAAVIGATASLIVALYTIGVIGQRETEQDTSSAAGLRAYISILEPVEGSLTIHGGGRTFPIRIESGQVPDDYQIYIFLEQAIRDANEWWRHQEDEGIEKNVIWESEVWVGNESEPARGGEQFRLWVFAAKSNLFADDRAYTRQEIRKKAILAEKEISLTVDSVE